MSYIIDGVTIRNPMNISEGNSTQMAQVRTLKGRIGRDYFGDNKRSWTFDYKNVTPAEQLVIKNLYYSYLNTGAVKTFESTEAAYIVSPTLCHLDLAQRKFSVGGTTYISDFSLTLLEA